MTGVKQMIEGYTLAGSGLAIDTIARYLVRSLLKESQQLNVVLGFLLWRQCRNESVVLSQLLGGQFNLNSLQT